MKKNEIKMWIKNQVFFFIFLKFLKNIKKHHHIDQIKYNNSYSIKNLKVLKYKHFFFFLLKNLIF